MTAIRSRAGITVVTRDAAVILEGRAVRAIGDGLVSVVPAAYLAAVGLSGTEIGVVVAATTLGAEAGAALAGVPEWVAERTDLSLVDGFPAHDERSQNDLTTSPRPWEEAARPGASPRSVQKAQVADLGLRVVSLDRGWMAVVS